MPRITDIKRQKRVGSTLFNIQLDGSYGFTMSDLDISLNGLRVGQELTEEEVEQFAASAKEAKAYALALRYLSVRVRSRRELLDYLKRKDCEAGDIESALDRLEGLGLIDDLKFAQAWIADRMAVRPRSRMRLAQELAAKGVAREVAETALAELEPEKELAKLKSLIARKRLSSGYQDENKLLGYLQRQGYRWSLIQEAMREIDDEI